MQKVPIDIVFKNYSRSKVTKISFSRISRFPVDRTVHYGYYENCRLNNFL